jgi:hypothetical protein
MDIGYEVLATLLPADVMAYLMNALRIKSSIKACLQDMENARTEYDAKCRAIEEEIVKLRNECPHPLDALDLINSTERNEYVECSICGKHL